MYSTALLSTAISGLACLVFWGEAKTLTAAIIFAFIYGAASGGYGVVRSRFSKTVIGNDDKDQILLVLGLFTATRGAGGVIGGVIGGRIVDEDASVHIKLSVWALGKWIPLVIFVGVGMLVAGVLVLVQYVNEKVEVNKEEKRVMERRHRWPINDEEIGVAV